MLEDKAQMIVGDYESIDEPYRGMVQFTEDGRMKINHDDIANGVEGNFKFLDGNTIELQVEYFSPSGSLDTYPKTWKADFSSEEVILTDAKGKTTFLKRVPNRVKFLFGDSLDAAFTKLVERSKQINDILEPVNDELSAEKAVNELNSLVLEWGIANKRIRLLGNQPPEQQEAIKAKFSDALTKEQNRMEKILARLNDNSLLKTKMSSMLQKLRDASRW